MIRKLLFVGFLFVLAACGPDEDDELPVVSINDLEVSEGDDQKVISVALNLSKTFSKVVSVNIKTNDGSAESGSDYVGIQGKIIEFQPGDQVKDIEITILGDTDFEESEMFEVEILSAQNALLIGGGTIGLVTLTNDDEGDPTMVWNDEFDGTSLNSSNWTFEINGDGGGNNELQYYTDQNLTVSNGFLTIEARQESFGGRNYTSSRIITMDKYEFKYGRVEIRAKLPQGQGMWPALWMLGANWSDVGWPACGEIDIMEMIGGSNRENTVHGTIHWQDPNGNPNNNLHAQVGDSYTLSSGTFSDDFHIFSIEWDENAVKWYVDGKYSHQFSITPSNMSELREPHFFIFNLAVGGNWPGSPDGSTTFPQQMVVDYIRVFQEQ